MENEKLPALPANFQHVSIFYARVNHFAHCNCVPFGLRFVSPPWPAAKNVKDLFDDLNFKFLTTHLLVTPVIKNRK